MLESMNSVVQILPRYIQRKAKTPIANVRCLGFSYLEFFSQSRYISMEIIPAEHLSFSFRASAAHCKNCSCVHLPAAMCAKRFLYSRRYAENTSSLFFLSAHTFGMLDANDDRIRSLLFKLCVETNMMFQLTR